MFDPQFSRRLDEFLARLQASPDLEQPVHVTVNIYDLDPKYSWARYIGLGLYHSGVVVAGSELAFGGHPFQGTGVYSCPPMSAPAPATFLRTLNYGPSAKTLREHIEIVRTMSKQWPGKSYNLTLHNCHDFSDMLLRNLGFDGLPGWVNRISRVGNFTGISRCISGGDNDETDALLSEEACLLHEE